jgi:prolyl 4-hydroxylase
MVDYMTNTVMVQDIFEPVRDLCRNKYRNCIEWANAGECDTNPSFMNNHCAPACQSCHLFIYEIRCPWNPSNATNIWKNPGDLDTAFRRIVEDNEFSVQVLSQPPNGPWVLTVENFLNDEECKGLIDLGTERGYEKSMDLGAMKPDGTFSDYDSGQRTSSNTWCLDECYTDERTKSVLARIEKLTGVPDAYQEYLQLLHYGDGQFYGRHHDYIPHHKDREEGVRIATVFLYLNDVDAGGGTNFPDVENITVMPKKGMALIWPSVLNDDPNAIDERTDHQALPVEKGVKYGANAWLRNRNFKDPFSRGCA